MTTGVTPLTVRFVRYNGSWLERTGIMLITNPREKLPGGLYLLIEMYIWVEQKQSKTLEFRSGQM